MKKVTLVSIISLVVGVVLLLGGMALMGFDFKNFSTVNSEVNTHEITESFDNISINVDTADVRFAQSQDGKCTVVCKENSKAKHSVSVTDGTLTVQYQNELKWYENIGINVEKRCITLYLPQTAYSSLTVDSDTGDVEMPAPFTFQNASVTTDTGDISWKATVVNSLSLAVDTGDIEVKNINANPLTIESNTGDVELSGVECTTLSVTTDTGKVDLTNVRCQNLSIKTDTGDVECENVIAIEKITVETDTGDVELNDCDGSELWIKTDTGDVSGRLLTDKHYICKSSTGKVRVPDTIGGRCEITTDTGDIYFR